MSHAMALTRQYLFGTENMNHTIKREIRDQQELENFVFKLPTCAADISPLATNPWRNINDAAGPK